MSRTGQIQKVLGPEWSIKFVKANGDCFFAAICTALDDDDSTVQKLRDIVADACTEDTLEMMRLARAAGCANYEHLRRVDDLEGLKSRLRVSGSDAGAGHCVWACDFCLQTVADRQRLGICIYDEQARVGSRFVSILPDERPVGVVCLQRTRRQHYNLLVRTHGEDVRRVGDVADAALRDKWPALARRYPDDEEASNAAKRRRRT